MARGRELSQLGSLITVDDSTKNIGVATATPSQKIGIGTLSPTSKVEVVGDVSISGVITASSFSGDGSALTNVPFTGGMSNLTDDTTPQLGGSLDVNGKDITGTGNVNITGIVTASSFSGDGSGLTGVASTDNIQTATSANFLSNVNITGITTCQALTVSGNLTVDGTTTTINSTTLTVDDKTIVIASGAADSSAADGAGISVDGASATILYSHSGTKFVSNKPFEATSFTGDVTGNADTATTLETARTIAGVSFDGSSNISLNNNAITNGAGYITTSHAFTNTNQLTNGAGFITSSDDISGNASTATALETARTIAGVSFDGTSNISLNNNAITNGAGYITTSHAFTNTNQLTNGAGFITSSDDISGNASTATALETARTIAGVSFDGTSNISLNNNAITNGAGYITTSHAFTNTNQLTNGAGFITSSGTVALAEGLTGTPNITVGTVNATSFSGDGSGLTGVASTDNIQTATKATFLNGVTVAGVTTTSSNVNVTGNVAVTGNISATNFNSTSDVTLKQDVSVIDNALEMISQLEGVSWKWKETLKPSLGVTAQNVEEVAPELVSNGNHKSVNYNGLIGILIEAVKELKSEVDELKR